MKRRSFLGFLAGLPFGWFATARKTGAAALPKVAARECVVTELTICADGAERGQAQYEMAMNLARQAMERALAATEPVEGQVHSLDADYFFSCAGFYSNRTPYAKANALRAHNARLIERRTFREDELVLISSVAVGGRA